MKNLNQSILSAGESTQNEGDNLNDISSKSIYLNNPSTQNEQIMDKKQFELFPNFIFCKSHDEVQIKNDKLFKLPQINNVLSQQHAFKDDTNRQYIIGIKAQQPPLSFFHHPQIECQQTLYSEAIQLHEDLKFFNSNLSNPLENSQTILCLSNREDYKQQKIRNSFETPFINFKVYKKTILTDFISKNYNEPQIKKKQRLEMLEVKQEKFNSDSEFKIILQQQNSIISGIQNQVNLLKWRMVLNGQLQLRSKLQNIDFKMSQNPIKISERFDDNDQIKNMNYLKKFSFNNIQTVNQIETDQNQSQMLPVGINQIDSRAPLQFKIKSIDNQKYLQRYVLSQVKQFWQKNQKQQQFQLQERDQKQNCLNIESVIQLTLAHIQQKNIKKEETSQSIDQDKNQKNSKIDNVIASSQQFSKRKSYVYQQFLYKQIENLNIILQIIKQLDLQQTLELCPNFENQFSPLQRIYRQEAFSYLHFGKISSVSIFRDPQQQLKNEIYNSDKNSILYFEKQKKNEKKLIGMEQEIIQSCPKLQKLTKVSMLNEKSIPQGTKFRGVSKNGRSSWQILTIVDGHKVYLASVDSILNAAIIYDILSIQTKGLKAKTNFSYSKQALLAVLNLENLLKFKTQD